MGQSWHDLLFAHWPVPLGTLRKLVPAELSLDERDGTGWIAITPFKVTGLHPRGLPPVPPLSSFPEVNVRTYVTVGGKPGIYFFSLDTSSRLGVMGARIGYGLPYFHAESSIENGGVFAFESHRLVADVERAELDLRYHPVGPSRRPEPGSLVAWLTERYCLYTLRGGQLMRGDIHHRPWQLADAVAGIGTNTMTAALGIELGPNPLLHYAERQDVVMWGLVRAEARKSNERPHPHKALPSSFNGIAA